jgi:hypothetical protein
LIGEAVDWNFADHRVCAVLHMEGEEVAHRSGLAGSHAAQSSTGIKRPIVASGQTWKSYKQHRFDRNSQA